MKVNLFFVFLVILVDFIFVHFERFITKSSKSIETCQIQFLLILSLGYKLSMLNKKIILMKKSHVCCLVIIFSLFVLNGFAQQDVKKNRECGLEGLWQQCQDVEMTEGPEPKIKKIIAVLPLFKRLDKDGKMCNMIMDQRSGAMFVSTEGTYKLTSDSTYVEQLEQSIYPNLVNVDSKLKFKIIDDDYLFLSFYLEKDGLGNPLNKWISELWIRVKYRNLHEGNMAER